MWTKYRVVGDSHICSLCCQRSSLDWKDEASLSPACSQEHKLVLVPTYGGPLAGTTYEDFPRGCLPFPQQGIWDQKYRLYNSTNYFLPTVQTTSFQQYKLHGTRVLLGDSIRQAAIKLRLRNRVTVDASQKEKCQIIVALLCLFTIIWFGLV